MLATRSGCPSWRSERGLKNRDDWVLEMFEVGEEAWLKTRSMLRRVFCRTTARVLVHLGEQLAAAALGASRR
jgi:hypothetical protein